MFIAALFAIAKTRKQHKHPLTDEWIKKMWYIYTMEYYSDIKKNKIMHFAATWMELEILILSEVSQEKKDKYHMISHIWNLKYGENEQKQTHGHRKQTPGCQGEREGVRWMGT
uniref:DUF1725 domain-containing protein n=1 Tax=Sus scrofa TaxID=9823 RepID=A0A8D1VNC0_PIG